MTSVKSRARYWPQQLSRAPEKAISEQNMIDMKLVLIVNVCLEAWTEQIPEELWTDLSFENLKNEVSEVSEVSVRSVRSEECEVWYQSR
jgi:hypothetical protein